MDQNKEERKETATDWLFRQLWETPKDKLDWYAILKKANEIHKEQVCNAFEQGVYEGVMTDINYMKCEGESDYYYNERYGTDGTE